MLITTLIVLEDRQGTSPWNVFFIFTWFGDSLENLFWVSTLKPRDIIKLGGMALLNVEIKISKFL